MKILFVCFSYSIHAARWIKTVREPGWDIHIFPSQDFDALHAEFQEITYWPAQPGSFKGGSTIRIESDSAALHLKTQGQLELSEYLRRVIADGGFDIVHSLELQHAGYLTLDAISEMSDLRPRWIATNYGSDIFLYMHQPSHEARLRDLLRRCDFYSAECQRDVRLAVDLGLSGRVFEVCPNSGGIDLAECVPMRSHLPPSRRKVIAVKGYEHFAGRALTILAALEALTDQLRDYRVVIYSPSPPVREAAVALGERSGLNIECLADNVDHATILALHGMSRISVANSISDGISTALLEAMAMGSFPIQSCTACADEWIVPGRTGLVTDPTDQESICRAIEHALQDDELVDRAALENADKIRLCADREILRGRISLAYSKVMAEMAALRAALAPPPPACLPQTRNLPEPRRACGPFKAPPQGHRPTLTVITPSYNRADFLAETIESVLAQDFQDFEYLIFDDGSRDNTAEVVRSFDDPRIKYVHHANVGETLTVNRALRQVSGEFFTIINSDDPAVADSFSVLLEAMRQDDNILLVYPDWYLIDEKSEVKSIVTMPSFDVASMLTFGTLPIGPGAMFRSTVIEAVGQRDPLLRYCADLDYIFRVALTGRIFHVPEVLGTHRVHPGSASIADRGGRLMREAIYPTQVYALHPRLDEADRRLFRQGSAVGYFAAAFVTPDARFALRLFARAFLMQPVTALRLTQQPGLEGIIARLCSLGLVGGTELPPSLQRAMTSQSRQAAVRPFLRAFLSDPIRVLEAACGIGHAELERQIRALPFHA